MPRGMSLPRPAGQALGALSRLAAGALDEARGLSGRGAFARDHVVIDAWLPTSRLDAARRLIAADPAGHCPLPPELAVLALAGPVREPGQDGPPWRYRLAIARRADLLEADGRAVPTRRVRDPETGLALAFSPPPRRLTGSETRALAAGVACLIALSWALSGAADWLDRTAAAMRAEARTLAAASPERGGSDRLGDLLQVLADTPGIAEVAAVTMRPENARLTLTSPDTGMVATHDGVAVHLSGDGRSVELVSPAGETERAP